MSALSQFRGARARLQRYTDAKFFSGWVVDITPAQIILQIDRIEDLIPEDSLSIEIHGLRHTIVFSAAFESPISGSNYIFRIVGTQLVRGSDAGARYQVRNYEAMVFHGAMAIEGSVDNVSETGMGLRVRGDIPKGSRIRIQVLLPRGEMEVEGTVVHAAAMDLSGLDFRLGVRLEIEDRISKARWIALMKDVSEAA